MGNQTLVDEICPTTTQGWMSRGALGEGGTRRLRKEIGPNWSVILQEIRAAQPRLKNQRINYVITVNPATAEYV
jgi:hypothetical protein